jgi:mannan endo-1,4-beta-mannosidase
MDNFISGFLKIKSGKRLPFLCHNTATVCFLAYLIIFSSCTNNSPTATKTKTKSSDGTMQVKGRFLHSAAGEKVILRGVNEMMIWSRNKTGEQILPEIAKSGANCVRLAWTTEGDPFDLDYLIKNCLKNHMIPMVELHDATGDWNKLPIVIDYWLRNDVRRIVQKYEKWVLVNIANEVGTGNTPDSVFVKNYKNAIRRLRESGYRMPLIIDGSDWGKDEKIILRNWRTLLQHDPLKNLMFSVHTYWTDKKSEERIDKLLSRVVQDTIPFLFGEGPEPYGWDCQTVFPYIHCIRKCKELEIGWLCWSWGDVKNGDCAIKGAFDMTTDGKFGNWNSDWARLVTVDDEASIKNTSVRPQSLIEQY